MHTNNDFRVYFAKAFHRAKWSKIRGNLKTLDVENRFGFGLSAIFSRFEESFILRKRASIEVGYESSVRQKYKLTARENVNSSN